MRPTQRSLKLLRSEGWLCQVVEQTIHAGKLVFKRDLFEIGDIIAIKAGATLLVQTTSASNYSAHLRKIFDAQHFTAICEAGWRVELHGWSKKGPRGKAKRWECRREELTTL